MWNEVRKGRKVRAYKPSLVTTVSTENLKVSRVSSGDAVSRKVRMY
jgi:hypothetical protein